MSSTALINRLKELPAEKKRELLALLEQQEHADAIKESRTDLLKFAKLIYQPFKEGPHHRIIWNVVKDVLDGKKNRVIINVAPRMGKSLLLSYLFVAFYLGLNPDKKIIMATHTAGLSEDFGRQVRNLIKTEEYQKVFPKTQISSDQKAAGQWGTSLGGQYFAVGVGGALAGRGADLLLVDDPHNEQDVMTGGKTAFDKTWTWFQTGPLQRLMPSGRVIVIHTRWSDLDLTGRLIDFGSKNDDADQWEVIELPAILPSGKSLWPEQWPVDQLLAKKASMDPKYWNAQYMQDPTAEESAYLKREWWRKWERDAPPPVDFCIITLDGAFTEKNTANYSAMTVWGVWHTEDPGPPQLILLDAWRDRVEFPELKRIAKKHFDYWKQAAEDSISFVIEAKASGIALIHELRAMGIPVQDFQVNRGTKFHPNDKTSRVQGVTDVFASGMVWAPDTRWAVEVMEECAKFPSGANDDYVDCTVMALMRFRQGGFVRLPSDYEDKEKKVRRRSGYAI